MEGGTGTDGGIGGASWVVADVAASSTGVGNKDVPGAGAEIAPATGSVESDEGAWAAGSWVAVAVIGAEVTSV